MTPRFPEVQIRLAKHSHAVASTQREIQNVIEKFEF